MFRSLRARVRVVAVAALLVGLPVLGTSSPASASPDSCATFSGTANGVSSFDLGTLTFSAGEQLVVTAKNPVNGATEFNLGDPNLLAQAPVPGTIDYTVPATVTAHFLGGLVEGTPAAADFSWSCTPALSQTISFTNAPATAVAGGSYTPSATATSNLPVSFTLDGSSTGCSLSAGTVSFIGVGTCVVDADQSGGGTYAPAPTVPGSTVISAQCGPGSFSATGGTPCAPAPAGSFVNVSGAMQATPCLAGTFSSIQGAQQCVQAMPGNFVDTPGGTLQMQCLPGTFSSAPGAAECMQAPAGSFVDETGATLATQCGLGTFSASPGAQACQQAPAGFFVGVTGAIQALQCGLGTFSASPGAQACQQAPAGFFVGVTGALQATQCSKGTFSASPGAQLCQQAPAGFFVGVTGATQALQCTKGSFSASPGAQSCTPAPAGSFVNVAGATQSTLCGLGTFSSVPGEQLCLQAQAGSFVGGMGETQSALCGLGTFSAAPGASVCTQAPIGSFVGTTGATSAMQCPAGTTTTAVGASACSAIQQPQTISFGALGSALVGAAPFPVAATASSGLPVSFASLSPTVCTVSGTTVTIVSAGLCTIQASQAGSSSFLPAVPVLQSFMVSVYSGSTSGECKGPALTAPTHPSSAPGNGSATVSWFPTQYAAPVGCVAGYVLTPSLNGVAQAPILIPGGGTTTVLPSLTNGGVYTFTVSSEDGVVVGPPSTPTAKITVGTPSAATSLKLTHSAKRAIRVAFKTPRSNGAAITKYTATCRSSNGGVTRTASGKAGPLTVTALTPGKTYTCTVTATNSRGTGAPAHSGPIKA